LQPGNSDDGVLGAASLAAEYLTGDIYFSDELELSDEVERRRIILHELRHCHYAALAELMKYLFDGRRKVSRVMAIALIDREIEKAIERDIQVLQKAYRGR